MRLEPDRGPVVPQQWDGAPRGAIVTAAGPRMRTVLHELALPSFRRYADRWGWTVRPTDLAQDGAGADPHAQQAKWAKVSLLRQALRWYPLVLWLDADVLLTRVDEDVTTYLHPAAFQALALEYVPHEHRVNPNTGVWLLRSCPQAFAFLEAVNVAGPQPGPWSDQGAVLAALGWDLGDDRHHWARPGPGGPALVGTSWLPPGWNQPYLEGRVDEDLFNSCARSYAGRPQVADPHALHFMGMTPAARYQHMRAAVAPVPVAP